MVELIIAAILGVLIGTGIMVWYFLRLSHEKRQRKKGIEPNIDPDSFYAKIKDAADKTGDLFVYQKYGYIPNRESHKSAASVTPAADTCEDSYSVDETTAKQLCAKLKQNMRVDSRHLDNAGFEFKCHLTTNYTALKLNFEIKNISGIPWTGKNGQFVIKGNVYDAKGNLLDISECAVEDEKLTNGRYADFLYFDFDELAASALLDVYVFRDKGFEEID